MKINRSLKAVAFVALLICLAIPRVPAGATFDQILPTFSDFVAAVSDGPANIIRGVYAPGILAFRVMQQPADDPGSVLQLKGVVTQFNAAALNKVIGLLAHNNLAGASFSSLRIGQEIRIVFGDGRVEYFMVNRLARFKALQPNSLHGNFMDLSTNIIYTTQEIFTMFYEGFAHVTFQTCIQFDDIPSWGRLFVTAIPISATYLREMQTIRLNGMQDNLRKMNVFELRIGNVSFR